VTASPETPRATLGQLIRDERQRHRLTLAEVGAAAGVGRSHVCDIEHGRRMPSFEVCRDILEVLGLSEHEAIRAWIVAPEIQEWASQRPALSVLLGVLAHWNASNEEVEALAAHVTRSLSSGLSVEDDRRLATMEIEYWRGLHLAGSRSHGRPRGVCDACGFDHAIDGEGLIWRHQNQSDVRIICEGSGSRPRVAIPKWVLDRG